MMPCKKTGCEKVGPLKISRRAMISLSSIAGLAANQATGAGAPHDEAAAACQRFVELHDQAMTLADEWPVLESWLCWKYPGFIGMSDEEQTLLPGAARLEENIRERDAIDHEIEKLLPVVLKVKCRTPAATVAKLMAAERLIYLDENPEAKRLLISCIEDLGKLLSVETSQWVSPYPLSPVAWQQSA
jgi:hypothetical protein